MRNILLIFIVLTCTISLSAQTKVQKEDLSDTAFQKVEIESEYPGGIAAWTSFLEGHLTYPNKAVRKKVEGTVVLQFIVCTDGTVCDVEAISGPPLLREAAVKAFKSTPNWIPAMQSGKKVKSYKKQPITFRLQ